MDPNANLKEMRALIKEHLAGKEIDVDLLVELVDSLDNWLSNGGFLPADWEKRRK